MSLQWSVVALILYVEIVILLLLLLPWLRPSFWNRIFKSRMIRWFEKNAYVYSIAGTAVLLLLFMDAIREVRKYAAEVAADTPMHTAGADNAIHMRLFRAQRNLYVSGFALLLFLVIKRLMGLLSRGAQLEAAAEAALKQAEGANRGSDSEKVKELEREVDEMSKKMKSAQNDRDAMKEQAEGLQREYDRVCQLLSEHKFHIQLPEIANVQTYPNVIFLNQSPFAALQIDPDEGISNMHFAPNSSPQQ
ncbi:B-cell receptor-associated protein 31 [Toxocara canis]|uniref:Endoplasmic reticulum transmembrane protein n=1 Tax=Toxocara canis TaxID=6265 RepID=A0A0B2UMF6_TOXCA|nr:B-cell receptor-associated protein 31 [Toxocara canis]